MNDLFSQHVMLYSLTPAGYDEVDVSRVLPGVTCNALEELIALSAQMRRAAWVRHAQNWARGTSPEQTLEHTFSAGDRRTGR